MEKTNGATAIENAEHEPVGEGVHQRGIGAENLLEGGGASVWDSRAHTDRMAIPHDTESGLAGSGAERAGAGALHPAEGWNEARVARLIELWQRGESAKYIAADLGGLTRNAVLGKVHRMGISERPNGFKQHPNSNRRARPLTPYEKALRQKKRIQIRQSRAPQKIPVSVTPKVPEPQSRMLNLCDLTATTCRWPSGTVGESDFGFCGHEIAQGSYCAHHASAAYTKPRRVTDEDREHHRCIARRFLSFGLSQLKAARVSEGGA